MLYGYYSSLYVFPRLRFVSISQDSISWRTFTTSRRCRNRKRAKYASWERNNVERPDYLIGIPCLIQSFRCATFPAGNVCCIMEPSNRLCRKNIMSTLTASPNVAEQELTEEERQQKVWDYYEQEVLRGLESGPSIPLTPEYWNEFLQKREERKTAKQAGKKP